MNSKVFLFVICMTIFSGCTCANSNTTSSNLSEDSTKNENESLANDSEGYDWTPEEFKKKHYDEWIVVKQSINIQQQDKNFDFGKIDNLVKEYIQKKNIKLPESKYEKIKKIEEICHTKFDIDGYDGSNMGMNIADGTYRLFEAYVSWLMFNEAVKIKGTGIILKEEESEVDLFMDAFKLCCDSIGYAFEGSGGWHGYADVYRLSNNFKQSMYKLLLVPERRNKLPYLLTSNDFKVECEARSINYNPSWEGAASPERVKALLDNYAEAAKRWLQYRNQTEERISNPIIKSEYSYITRSFAKSHYIHLKNQFEDIGLMSGEMCDNVYLQDDCSDELMLKYSYEEAYKRYIPKIRNLI